MVTTLRIPESAIRQYLADTNPWWSAGQGIDDRTKAWPRRAYFPAFLRRLLASAPRRALVLIGPRRVGGSSLPVLRAGDFCLLPACLPKVELIASPNAQFLRAEAN